jgi:AcrR family transcriptional regulator
MIEIDDTLPDSRRAHVLGSASKVFLSYGFAKATMDDIARAAEMSRPAVYLLFKNKADIYRSIATDMLTLSAAQAKAELDQTGPFTQRMERAVDVAIISMIASFSMTPHGAEFLDMKSGLGDLIGIWRGQLMEYITAAITSEAIRNGVDLAAKGLPAEMLADTLLDQLDGIKARTIDPDAQRKAAQIQIRLIGSVLQY